MKFLSLFLLIGSAVATLRGGVSQQQVLSVGEETAPRNNKVTFVYIRHGQSMGNAKLFWRASDGRLTFKGKMDARKGATKGGKIQILCKDPDHTLYAMSPLRRTTATFLLTYIWACFDVKAKTIDFPNIANVEIWISLREKRKSKSEDANSGWNGGKKYIVHEATKECETLIKHGALTKDQLTKCTAFGTALAAKWEAAMTDEDNEEKVKGKTKLVSNKGQFLAQMENLSKRISSSVKSNKAEIRRVLAVAHSGTGRIRFGCPMAAGSGGLQRFSDVQKEENLILGMVPKADGRKTLGNGGSMILTMDVSGTDAQVTHSGAFYGMEADKKPMPFAGSLSVSDGSDIYTKECIAFGVIPKGSMFTKAEGFSYSGDNYSNKNLLGKKVMKRVSEKSAAQATFSHSPGKKKLPVLHW